MIRKLRSTTGKIKGLVSTLVFMGLYTQTVLAETIQDSKFVQGTVKLLEDGTTGLLIIAPVAMIIAVVWCFIRKGMSDEMDHKKWNSRIATAFVCGIGAVSASILVKLLMGYYS